MKYFSSFFCHINVLCSSFNFSHSSLDTVNFRVHKLFAHKGQQSNQISVKPFGWDEFNQILYFIRILNSIEAPFLPTYHH